MPLYPMYATMSENPLPDVPVRISYHFSNGRVTCSSRAVSLEYWGKHTSDSPRQYKIADARLIISGNVFGFYCEFNVDCDADHLTGTITVAKALPVAVVLGISSPTRPNVRLSAGQLQLDFRLQAP